MITTLEKYLVEALIGLVLIAIIFGLGYYIESKNFSAYKTEQQILVKDRNDEVAKLNKQLKDNSQNAETQLQDTSKAISDWYVSHPVVRLQPNTCSQQGTGPTNNTVGPNGITAATDAQPYFISSYDPEQVEQVANRLDQLQKLLIKDGVKIGN